MGGQLMVDVFSYSTTNVTTSVYVTLDASTKVSCSALSVVDTSTQLLKLAVGAVGSEIDICTFQGNGSPVLVPAFISSGSRLSLKAISASATSGFNSVSFF